MKLNKMNYVNLFWIIADGEFLIRASRLYSSEAEAAAASGIAPDVRWKFLGTVKESQWSKPVQNNFKLIPQ